MAILLPVFVSGLLWNFMFYVHAKKQRKSKGRIVLQINSEVYKKPIYIPMPTAWLSPTLRLQIGDTVQKSISPKWNAKEITFKGKWAKTLKFHPAANIGIFSKKYPKRKKIGILLLYPHGYKDFIEDPFADNPPPIIYLGSTTIIDGREKKRVAFYYYPQQKKVNRQLLRKITSNLKGPG